MEILRRSRFQKSDRELLAAAIVFERSPSELPAVALFTNCRWELVRSRLVRVNILHRLMADMLHSIHGSALMVLMLNSVFYLSLVGASRLSRVNLGGGDSFVHV
jgi:hypothetical protein